MPTIQTESMYVFLIQQMQYNKKPGKPVFIMYRREAFVTNMYYLMNVKWMVTGKKRHSVRFYQWPFPLVLHVVVDDEEEEDCGKGKKWRKG